MFYGANTAELTAFARRCDAGAQGLGDLLQRLDAIVLSVDWQGPDAETLRETWSTRTAPELGRTAEMLRGRGGEARMNADAQEDASSQERPSTDPRHLLRSAAAGIGEMIGGLDGHPSDRSRLGPGFLGTEMSQEISGIAPGEPDPGGSIWEWILGERDSPLPDLPGDSGDKAPTGDPGDLGDLGDVGRGDGPTTVPTEPTKPANWPDDMPWPPNGPTPEAGDDGQYVYGDAGYGAAGDATADERPVGTAVDEGGAAGGSAGTAQGGGYAEGQWAVSGGASATEDEHSNFTVTAGGRAGAGGELGLGTEDGTGVTGSGSAEVYAEGGLTVGADGYGVGWRAGAQVSGSASYSEVNEDGSSSIYTVEAHGEVDAHASHYGHRVRNGDGETTGWATGFDIGAGASAGYSYTEERVSPNGWFQTSTTTTDGVGRGAGLEANTVISTDEVSISIGGGLPGRIGDDLPSGFAVGINPNKVVDDLSGGAFDADDVVTRMNELSPYDNPAMPAWA